MAKLFGQKNNNAGDLNNQDSFKIRDAVTLPFPEISYTLSNLA